MLHDHRWFGQAQRCLVLTAFVAMGGATVSAAATCNFVRSAGAAGGQSAEPRLAQEAGEPDFVPGELIVKFVSAQGFRTFSTDDLSLTSLGDEASLIVDTSLPTPPGHMVLRINTFTAQSGDQLKALTRRVRDELAQREDIEYVDLNIIFSAQGTAAPTDPCYSYQWHYWDNGAWSKDRSPGGISLPRAWQKTTGDGAVVVAVLDTGQLFDHEDFSIANFVDGYDAVDNDMDPSDRGIGTDWHGTHVAGTIGSLATDNGNGAASSNWQVKIQPVRVLGDNGSGRLRSVANAVLWASGITLTGVPANKTPARIINMSLGAPTSCQDTRTMQEAIDTARSQGVLVIAAAGNSRTDVAGFVPAGCDNVLTVSASDGEGQLVSRYSNFGAKVDILAPGGDHLADANHDGVADGVLSAVDGGFALYEGTSMAAPHVAGVAALVVARWPRLTPDEIEKRILDAAIPRSNSECPRPCGVGLLNADLF